MRPMFRPYLLETTKKRGDVMPSLVDYIEGRKIFHRMDGEEKERSLVKKQLLMYFLCVPSVESILIKNQNVYIGKGRVCVMETDRGQHDYTYWLDESAQLNGIVQIRTWLI